MEPITRFTSRFVALPVDNVDTDQIIPARFLKVTDRAGLGDALFADWRYRPDGSPDPAFVLNRPEAAGAAVLVAGRNFGCGSSREHAPWALLGYGFRAVVGTGFADIFRGNALRNGLLPVDVDEGVRTRLLEAARAAPDATVTVDLEATTLVLPDGECVRFPIDAFARHCLLNGIDALGYLLSLEPEIARYEAGYPERVPAGVAIGAPGGRGEAGA
ncbi:MAG TPA: 3-isopropylmalate dehydratase small subunit [Longimicrobiales bacterium]